MGFSENPPGARWTPTTWWGVDRMNDYTEFCPNGSSGEWFNEASKEIINSFVSGKTPPPTRDIERELKRVRSALKNLSTEARAELISREITLWQNDRPEGTWFDDAYLEQRLKLRDDGSAVNRLETIVEAKFRRDKQRTAIKRRDLIAKAAFIFSSVGGTIAAAVNSPFVDYLQRLFLDAGLESADCSKAVRDFLAENDGVLDG